MPASMPVPVLLLPPSRSSSTLKGSVVTIAALASSSIRGPLVAPDPAPTPPTRNKGGSDAAAVRGERDDQELVAEPTASEVRSAEVVSQRDSR